MLNKLTKKVIELTKGEIKLEINNALPSIVSLGLLSVTMISSMDLFRKPEPDRIDVHITIYNFEQGGNYNDHFNK